MPNDRARQEDASPPPGRTPVVVVQGLTYRDLQRAIFLSAALFLIYRAAGPLSTLLLFFLLVFILSAVLNPIVVWLQRFRIPRIVSAVTLAVLFLGFVLLLGSLVLPPLAVEAGKLIGTLDDRQRQFIQLYNNLQARYPELARQLPPANQIIQNITPSLTNFLGKVGMYTVNLVAVLISLVLMLVLVIFTLANPAPLLTGLLGAVPDPLRARTERALRRILQQLKQWAFGSLVLGIIVGLMTGVGLYLVGMLTGHHPFPYILLFSVIAAVGELIPNIGPVISAIPPILIALGVDPKLAVAVLVLFVIIQQIENNAIVPLVMGQSLNLHPLSVIFTVLVMGALFGLLGGILAVPVCAIVKVCWEEFYLAARNVDVDALSVTAEDIVCNGANEDALHEEIELVNSGTLNQEEQ